MLGCHPELYGFPELKLFAHDTVGALLDAPPALASLRRTGLPWDPAPGLRRAVAEVVFRGQDAETLACAERWLEDRRDWPTATLFDMLLDFVAPLAGVEKSPDTIFDEAGPHRALSWYPFARFIHLVRHPVSFQLSLQRLLLLFDRPEVCARAWLSTHRRIARFCAGLPAGQSMLVRVEEALSGSDCCLAELVRFLGVSDDDVALEQMRHPENSEYRFGGGTGLSTHWDPGFLASPALRPAIVPGALRAPREWRVPDSIEEEIVELAESFGYR
jgi:hypothetical protein